MKKRLIIGATGASGMPILIQCLKLMKEQDDFESYLIMTDSAKLTLEHETKMKIEEIAFYSEWWRYIGSVKPRQPPADWSAWEGASLSEIFEQ